MARSPEYEQGKRFGIKWAVTWLHEYANTMNDAHARSILNCAAHGMGIDAKRHAADGRGIERLERQLDEAIARAERAEARVKVLREALEPFARMWKVTDGPGHHTRSIPATLFMDALIALAQTQPPAPDERECTCGVFSGSFCRRYPHCRAPDVQSCEAPAKTQEERDADDLADNGQNTGGGKMRDTLEASAKPVVEG